MTAKAAHAIRPTIKAAWLEGGEGHLVEIYLLVLEKGLEQIEGSYPQIAAASRTNFISILNAAKSEDELYHLLDAAFPGLSGETEAYMLSVAISKGPVNGLLSMMGGGGMDIDDLLKSIRASDASETGDRLSDLLRNLGSYGDDLAGDGYLN